MRENPPVWVVLAPTDSSSLEREAAGLRRERLGWGEKYLPKWQVKDCAGGYAAVVNRNPGTQNTLESPLAAQLSLAADRPVYVLYFDEDADARGVLVYEGGRCTGDLPDDPEEFARSRGCALSGGPEAVAPKGGVRGVVVVEGASAAESARALGYDEPPAVGELRIVDGPLGALVAGVSYAELSLASQRLGEAFKRRDVYVLSTGPTPGRFLCWVSCGGESVGVFALPAGSGGAAPRLDSVKGQTTPASIADALGVPREWLDLPREE